MLRPGWFFFWAVCHFKTCGREKQKIQVGWAVFFRILLLQMNACFFFFQMAIMPCVFSASSLESIATQDEKPPYLFLLLLLLFLFVRVN